MADIDKATDTPLKLDIGGKKYEFKQLTISDYGKVTRHLKSLYIGEVAKSLKVTGVPDKEIIKTVLKLQMEDWNKRNDKELRTLLESNEAVVYTIYLSLKKTNPQITLEEVETLVSEHPQEMMEVTGYVMGVEPEKNEKKERAKK